MSKDKKLEVIKQLDSEIKSFNENFTKLTSNLTKDNHEKLTENINKLLNELSEAIKVFKPKLGSSETFTFLRDFKERWSNIYVIIGASYATGKPTSVKYCLSRFKNAMNSIYFNKLNSFKQKDSSATILNENLKKLVELLSDSELPKLITTKS